jgi:nicotinamidase-related amidase
MTAAWPGEYWPPSLVLRIMPITSPEAVMKTALLVVDVQQSFTRRAYWGKTDASEFVAHVQELVDQFEARALPILQVFHLDESEGPDGVFSRHAGFVKVLPSLRLTPTDVFYKSVHSAMFASNAAGQSVDYWLRRNEVNRIVVTGIRTEQCCETTTRHASDLGYSVTYAIDATLTFPMVSRSGRTYSVDEIRERTELVLSGRFAEVMRAAAVRL